MKNKKLLIYIIATLSIITVVAAFYLVARNNDSVNTQNSPATEAQENETETTSDAPTAQADYSEAEDERIPGNSLSENDGFSSVEDNSDSPVTPTDNAVESKDGKTSVYTPAANQVISSGSTVSGSTQNDNVYFRLIDSKSGVIGEGKLPIKSNGDFSGKFTIDSRSSDGRLDIFSRSSDGNEYSAVYIDVRFE